ncbi:MAG: FtsH-binding integral membrane protein [Myxococcota bacterium]|jgi:FtsH-binding integral membrane protein
MLRLRFFLPGHDWGPIAFSGIIVLAARGDGQNFALGIQHLGKPTKGMSMMEESVWDRAESPASADEILSPAAYNAAIGGVLAWGFGVNFYMVENIPPEWPMQFGLWPFLIGYMACCFGGVMLYSKSDNPAVSFLGYNLVVIPFGLVINSVVANYNPAIVLEAVRVTGAVTIVMMCLGTMYPAFFQRIVGALTVALFAVIIVEMVGYFFFGFSHGITDWAVAVIFCGYIGYDWGRANQIPKTLDNAVDSAAAIYMDIINLFLRILRIMGRRN